MATADAMEHSHVDVIKKQIIEMFDVILSEVTARREALLAQVDKMRIAYKSQRSCLIESQRELEVMKAQLEKIPMKQNLATKKRQDSLADIKSEIQELSIKLSSSSLKFECSINLIIQQVKEFGEVIDISNSLTKYHSKYSKKLTVDQIVSQNLPFGWKKRVHIDTENDLLYVFSTNATNALIFVYDAKDFTFIESFGITKCYERCLTTSKDLIYLGRTKSYNRSELLSIDRGDYSIIREVNYTGDVLSNIFVECENQILVLCVFESKVKFHIYDRALNFKRELEIIYEWPQPMEVVRSRFRQEQLFLLIENKLLVFNTLGMNTHSITIEGESSICNPNFFWIDEVSNIIVSVSATQSIRFFSPEGDLFHEIGEGTVGSELVKDCYDITMYKDTLIVACHDQFRTY